MKLSGSCHCGNIAFDLDWGSHPEQIPARACNCSFCVKHGGVWTSSPAGSLQVAIRDLGATSVYRFGTGTASFHVCSRCGVVPVVSSEIDGRLYAVVNINALNDVDRSRIRPAPISFDGEDAAARLARRARGWIPDVQFRNGGR